MLRILQILSGLEPEVALEAPTKLGKLIPRIPLHPLPLQIDTVPHRRPKSMIESSAKKNTACKPVIELSPTVRTSAHRSSIFSSIDSRLVQCALASIVPMHRYYIGCPALTEGLFVTSFIRCSYEIKSIPGLNESFLF
jgi:hypothetical protein